MEPETQVYLIPGRWAASVAQAPGGPQSLEEMTNGRGIPQPPGAAGNLPPALESKPVSGRLINSLNGMGKTSARRLGRVLISDTQAVRKLWRAMIITRTPFRLTLGGGGTDLPSFYRERGGFILAVGIDSTCT